MCPLYAQDISRYTQTSKFKDKSTILKVCQDKQTYHTRNRLRARQDKSGQDWN